MLPALPSAELVGLRTSLFAVCDSHADLDCDHLGLNGHFTSIVAVPEPQSHAQMIAGLGVVGLLARRRRR